MKCERCDMPAVAVAETKDGKQQVKLCRSCLKIVVNGRNAWKLKEYLPSFALGN